MRKLDWTRSYAENFGGSGGRYTQDEVDFNSDGTEFIRPVEPEPDTAAEDALEAAAEEEPERRRPQTPPPLGDKHWREVKSLYEFHGFKDWDSLPERERKKTAITRIRKKMAT